MDSPRRSPSKSPVRRSRSRSPRSPPPRVRSPRSRSPRSRSRSPRARSPRSRSPAPRARSPRSRSPRGRSPPRGRRSPRRDSRDRSPRRDRSPPPRTINPGDTLYVTGLASRTRESDLERKFSKYGEVVKAHLVCDPRTGDSRGFAFVTMGSDNEAKDAMEGVNRTELDGRIISVEKSKRARPRSPTPGRYLGHEKGSSLSRYGGGGYGGGGRYGGEYGGYGGRSGGSSYSGRRYDPYERRDRRSPSPRSRRSPDYSRRSRSRSRSR